MIYLAFYLTGFAGSLPYACGWAVDDRQPIGYALGWALLWPPLLLILLLGITCRAARALRSFLGDFA